MDFDFSEEQRALRDVARGLFAAHAPVERLRALWEGHERGDEVWKALADVGLLGVTVPAEHGGAGGDAVDLVLVLEEAGRAALPEPLLETAGVAAPVLDRWGGDLRERWLAAIAAGEAVVAIALAGDPAAHAVDADLLLVERGGELVAVEPDEVEVVPAESEDRARSIARVTARSDAGTSLGVEAGADARRRAAAGAAAVLNGVSARLVDLALDHARTREQFGRPIGAFQAVKHALADAHLLVETARASAWYAAYAISRETADAPVAAAAAKALASDVARRVNEVALQVHGGIGFTWEHPLHLWLKRGKALEAAYGGARAHRATIAAELFEGAG